MYPVVEYVHNLTAQVFNIEDKDEDEDFHPMEDVLPTRAYGETWALDLEPAMLGNWAAMMEALPPTVSQVDTAGI